VTISIGVSSLKGDQPISADSLLQLADQALYLAKDGGRNRVESHTM
jgi:diguanylate cyclase (GGDEF)-like protein